MNGVEKAVNGVTALGTIIMHIVNFYYQNKLIRAESTDFLIFRN